MDQMIPLLESNDTKEVKLNSLDHIQKAGLLYAGFIFRPGLSRSGLTYTSIWYSQMIFKAGLIKPQL